MCEASGQASCLFIHVTWMGQGRVNMSKVPFFLKGKTSVKAVSQDL